ncbi:MAG: Gx transporter family protein [Lachnospiraceae bacterium]|nr:Gx transporter family protein [Lachnospiraceae bacterium]
MRTHKLTTLAMFTTLALIIFTIESVIPPLVPIPGIKLGLSNIITLIVLCNYSPKDTFLVLMMRILLSSFFFGQALSLLYSLSGGILCFFAMLVFYRILQGHYLFLISCLGAIFHNLGQLGIAYLVTEVPGVLAYLPFLLISGILTGLFTGLCATFTQRFLKPVIAAAPFCPKEDVDN